MEPEKKIEETPAQKCAQEIDVILEKYQCQLICEQQIMYGQSVFVPKVAPIKK